ncbi:histidine phosphatase family protein [Sporolactobacillus sp. Y61]|uniref:Histidine phosphatase family protein n=1 Tax=Sporolactobacillus sp. Y61 TaxID=3160863 RepID=A0AAU8IGA8_9BACL
MHIVFIRHAEPNYETVRQRRFIGHGIDLAGLSEKGVRQAEAVSKNEKLRTAQIILSSPYTRALQTAAIISKNTGLDIKVETDLHEWLPDTTFQYSGPEHFIELLKEVKQFKGEHNAACKYKWESYSQVKNRAVHVLEKYMDYQNIAVVTHGVLIRQFVNQERIPYCGLIETDMTN